MRDFDEFVETGKHVNGVDGKRRFQKGLIVVTDYGVVGEFGHEDDGYVTVVLNDLDQHLWRDSEVKHGVGLDLQ